MGRGVSRMGDFERMPSTHSHTAIVPRHQAPSHSVGAFGRPSLARSMILLSSSSLRTTTPRPPTRCPQPPGLATGDRNPVLGTDQPSQRAHDTVGRNDPAPALDSLGGVDLRTRVGDGRHASRCRAAADRRLVALAQSPENRFSLSGWGRLRVSGLPFHDCVEYCRNVFRRSPHSGARLALCGRHGPTVRVTPSPFQHGAASSGLERALPGRKPALQGRNRMPGFSEPRTLPRQR